MSPVHIPEQHSSPDKHEVPEVLHAYTPSLQRSASHVNEQHSNPPRQALPPALHPLQRKQLPCKHDLEQHSPAPAQVSPHPLHAPPDPASEPMDMPSLRASTAA